MENVLTVENNIFTFKGEKLSLDDMFDDEFYSWSNSRVGEYETGDIFNNCIYLYVIINVLAIKYYLEKNNIKKIYLLSASRELERYVLDAASLSNVEMICDKKWIIKSKVFRNRVIAFFEMLYLGIIQGMQKKEVKVFELSKNLCVIRTEAAKKKIRAYPHLYVLCEDKIGKGDFYTSLGRIQRMGLLWKAYIETYHLIDCLDRYMQQNGLDFSCEIAQNYAKLRFLPVCFYGQVLNQIMQMGWQDKFVSGNNLDMYACMEEKISKKNAVSMVCIPHGLEYGYKFPHGFTCDLFYTTSLNAANWLNKLYQTDKFVFSSEIAKKMFEIKYNRKSDKKVVYFSEPREPEVNIKILTELVGYLEKVKIPLYIKHHPKDDLKDYECLKNKIITIDNLQEALCDNVCIARKSTTLLEGTYNNSKCAAILINKKDEAIFNTFPSLLDDEIRRFKEIKLLCNWVCDLMEEQ